MKQIDHTWMPWTSEFKASVNKPVRDGLISPRSNFLLTRRLGRESIFQSELGEICSEKLGTAPLSMAYLFKTLWCKTWNCIVCSIHCHHSVFFFYEGVWYLINSVFKSFDERNKELNTLSSKKLFHSSF